MTELAPTDPRIPSRPGWGLVILSLPLVGVIGTIALYAGMWTLGIGGRPADGRAAELAFVGCAEAQPVVAARLQDMGLAPAMSARPDGFVAAVVLPADERVAAQIPATLTRPGRLEVRGGDGRALAGSADVRSASARMDLLMVPTTLVQVGPEAAARVTAEVRAHPDGELAFVVDGAVVGRQSNRESLPPGDLELSPPEPDGQARWDAVATWSVVLDHPLPCAVTAR